MVSFTSETMLACLATVVACCQLIDATIFAAREVAEDLPVAEDRIFKGKKLLGKKKNLLSLFTRAAQPQVFHTLSPIENYPIWKVHKYRGVELRPVQVVDLPTPFDYSAVKNYEYGVPAVDPVRAPHTEYGTPVVDYNSFGGVVKPIEPTSIITGGDVQFHAPTTYHHRGKLKALLGLLTAHKGLFSKLRNLKSWKTGGSYRVNLPEVQEIPFGGLENLNFPVPELPAIGLPSSSSAVTGGPYVRVQVASPAPVVNQPIVEYQPQYASQYQPQYAPQYQYQYPPQSTTEFSPSSVAAYQPFPLSGNPLRVPAPYYGAPPLVDSYGTPLPADAYSSASDQVLSFAVPDNSTLLEDRLPENGTEEEYNVENGEANVAGTSQNVEESPKYLSEEEKQEELTKTTAIQSGSNNKPNQIVN